MCVLVVAAGSPWVVFAQMNENDAESQSQCAIPSRFITTDPIFQIVSDDQIKILANRISSTRDSSYLVGNVAVQSARYLLRSNALEVATTSNLLRLDTPFVLSSGDYLVQGEELVLSTDETALDASNVEFMMKESQLNGSADSLIYRDDVAQLSGIVFSSCADVTKGWSVQASKIRLDQTRNRLTIRHLRLNLGSFPILYVPWVASSFVDAQRYGFQFPVVERSTRHGLSLGVPYTAKAGAFDVRVTGKVLRKRGAQLELEVARNAFELSIDYLPNDRRYLDDLSQLRSRDPSVDKASGERHHIGIKHRAEAQHWTATTNLNFYSDVAYQRDFKTLLAVGGAPFLEHGVRLEYQRGDLFGLLQLQELTSIVADDKRYLRLPEVDLRWVPQWGRFNLDVRVNHTAFREQSPKAVDDRSTRLHVEPRLSYRTNGPWFFSEFALSKTSTRFDYVLSDNVNNLKQMVRRRRAIDSFSVDLGVTLENEQGVILKPRMYYLNREFVDQTNLPRFDVAPILIQPQLLFSDEDYIGIDRIPGANRLSVGASGWTPGFGKNQTQLTYEIGTLYRFKREPEDALIQLIGGVDIQRGNFEFSAIRSESFSSHERNSTYLLARFRGNERLHLLGSYGLRDHGKIEQFAATARLPITKNWSLFLHHTRDLFREKEFMSFAGFSYENCCMRIDAILEHELEGFYDQFELREGYGWGINLRIELFSFLRSDKDLGDKYRHLY